MNEFEILFGLQIEKIKKVVIVLPFWDKFIINRFKIKHFSRGKLFKAANTPDFSVIHTGIGAPFVGDAVLHLKNSPCRFLIMIGSCGLNPYFEHLSVGNIICPSKCFAMESFTSMLLGKTKDISLTQPDTIMREELMSIADKNAVRDGTCLSVGSLKMEHDCLKKIDRENITVVDMECSAFFMSAEINRISAVSLLYISDIISERPFYKKMSKTESTDILNSKKIITDLICEFTKKRLIY